MYQRYGYFVTDLVSTTYRGESGKAVMDGLLDGVRRRHDLSFEGEALRFTDFSEGVDGLPKSNVLRFCNDRVRVVLRPSGTEPKLKIYYSVKAKDEAAANAVLEETQKAVQSLLEKAKN